MKNLAIIQARTSSSRLPNKVLLKLGGKTVLEQVISRVGNSKRIDMVVVATTTRADDDPIYELCSKLGVEVFRGSENDVLDRYYQCAKLYLPENVIRITADCPLMDPAIIDKVILEHMEKGYDYTSNVIEPTFPDGEDVEVMKYVVLKEAWELAALASQREHVTQYIIHNERYRKGNVYHTENLEMMRWTLDTQSDYIFISKIYEELNVKDRIFSMEDILEFLRKKPELLSINNNSSRNEGLVKSINNDFIMKD